MSFSLQKAGFWKRISAYLFDTVLLTVLVMAIAILANTVLKVDSYIGKLTEYRNDYANELGIDLEITDEEFQSMTEEEKEEYKAKYSELNKAMAKDKNVQNINVQIISRVLGGAMVSILLADLILYFIVPMCFKHGRTLGKKMFGLAVVRSNGVKVSTPVFFIRSMIGLYAIETMFPVMLVIMRLLGILGSIAFIMVALLGILQIVAMIVSPTNSCIHDLLTDTVVVDFASQKIYDTEADLIEAQKAYAAEQAAKTEHEAQ